MDKLLFFKYFQYTASHFSGTANDFTQVLTGDLNLHVVRMGHGIGLFGQFQ